MAFLKRRDTLVNKEFLIKFLELGAYERVFTARGGGGGTSGPCGGAHNALDLRFEADGGFVSVRSTL